MSEFFILVQTPAGANVGEIRTATNWSSTVSDSQMGDFSFSLPAGEPATALLIHGYTVRCKTLVAGTLTEIGQGIIRTVVANAANAANPSLLDVSGPGMAHELTYRTVNGLRLRKLDWFNPVCVGMYAPAAGLWHDYTVELADNNPATTDVVDQHADHWFYICGDQPYERASFTFSVPNTTVATAWDNYQYFDGEGWVDLAAFADGTDNGGKPWGQDGSFTFTRPDVKLWAQMEQVVDGTTYNGYWVRFRILAPALPNATVKDIRIYGDTPESLSSGGVGALVDIMALAPAGWTLNVVADGTATIEPMQFNRESVWEALLMVAERTGHHFRIDGTTRTLYWLGDEWAASTVRAVRAPEQISATTYAEIAYIESLERTGSSEETYTRIYPAGGGYGDDGQLDLTHATAAMSAGYTLHAADGYIHHDANDAASRRDVAIDFSDVVPIDASEAALASAADQLASLALIRLKRHIAATHEYSGSLVGLQGTDLAVGKQQRVVYDDWRDGHHSLAIDALLYVLAIGVEIAENGVLIHNLTWSTAEKLLADDEEILTRDFLAEQKSHSTAQQLSGANLARNTVLAPNIGPHRHGYAAIDSGAATLGEVLVADGDGLLQFAFGVTPSGHDVLSASHGDTTPAAVQQGDLITGQGANPTWCRLGRGAIATEVLVAGAAEPAWGTLAHSLTTGIGTDDHHAKSHAHTAADGSGAIASDQAISTTAGLTVGTTITQAVKVLRQVIVKTGIADNALTSIFRITTVDEADSADGGGYACFVRALIGHALAASGYTANASRVCEYAFSRAIGSAGAGVNSTIGTVLDNASAAVTPASRQIDTVTPALLETDEYQNDFQLTIDLSGTLVVTAQAVLEITLIWQGFTTPPAISAL